MFFRKNNGKKETIRQPVRLLQIPEKPMQKWKWYLLASWKLFIVLFVYFGLFIAWTGVLITNGWDQARKFWRNVS